MAKQQTEDELNLRRKARRRLIGAIALTLAVVVILPMVLDREPKSTGSNINLSIPDPDKVGEFVPRVAIPEVQPSAASSAVVTAPPAGNPDKGNAVVVHSQPGKANPGKVKLAPQKPAETQNTSKQAGAQGYVAQVGAYANADTAKQEFKKLKKWGFKVYTEKVGGNIRVRVGPYTDRDKAEKVAKLLEKHGYHPVIVSNK
ncbi:MAG TPA: SPOR domain-containing protein [Gallionella sp.]|nr:SPOR domain-containing protein [Gallionella sp.]